jgi:hypothetical protein
MYALGQLDEEERSRFEEHYFDCGECMDGVRAAYLMTRGAEATFHRPLFGEARAAIPAAAPMAAVARPNRLLAGGHWAWRALPYAAVLLLAAGTGMEHAALMRARAPQSVAATFPIRAQAKGAATPIVMPAAGGFIELDLDLLELAPRYQFEIRSAAAGHKIMNGEMAKPANSPVLRVCVPSEELRPGQYEAILTAATGRKNFYPFEVVTETSRSATP